MSVNSENNVKKGSAWSNMWAELQKVVWPTFGQTAKSTFSTIMFVLLITAILVLLNICFNSVNVSFWNMVSGS